MSPPPDARLGWARIFGPSVPPPPDLGAGWTRAVRATGEEIAHLSLRGRPAAIVEAFARHLRLELASHFASLAAERDRRRRLSWADCSDP